MTDTLRITRALRFTGEVRPPSDKSLTHRAFMLAGVAQGESTIRQPLLGEDCRATLQAVQTLGAPAEEHPEHVVIQGQPNWSAENADIDCGNSGTTMRLLSGMVASFPEVVCTLTGDASLSRRPMKRIATPLLQMGADIQG
ncbi:MAG: 3-phosphoshikimate 1-carboxyvinyltransferase, partial [Fimbriimonadaceae bacterium]